MSVSGSNAAEYCDEEKVTMSDRFDYETPGIIYAIFLIIRAKITKRMPQMAWLVDNQMGKRYPLDEYEEQVLHLLADSLGQFGGLARPTYMEICDKAFDEVASAIIERKNGRGGAFDKYAGFTPKDWHEFVGEKFAIVAFTQ